MDWGGSSLNAEIKIIKGGTSTQGSRLQVRLCGYGLAWKGTKKTPITSSKRSKSQLLFSTFLSNFRKNITLSHVKFSLPRSQNQNSFFIPPKRRWSPPSKSNLNLKSRAKDALLPIRKAHIFDVLRILSMSHKKVAKLMTATARNVLRHSMERGLDPTRLFLHGCIIGNK